jgi:rfaE bifunctional protein kinase chain/domain
VFTDDVTFSSSELINRYLNPFNPTVRAFLDAMRENGEHGKILDLIERVQDMRVLIVGDTILDEYRYVLPMSKTPKENLIATLYQSHEVFAGGVVATANHVASICREVSVVSILGAENDGLEHIRASIKPNVRLDLLARESGPSTLKCRYIDPAHMRKLFEVYYMDDSPIPEALQKRLNEKIADQARDYDAVIVNDFGHGMIMPSTVDTLCKSAKFLAINTQTNSANFGYNMISKYPRADYVCIDGPEARLSVREKYTQMEEIVTERLATLLHCPKIIVTQGQYGCVAHAAGEPTCQVPAFADKVVDTVGAGDAFLAITAPMVAAGGAMRHVAFLGNVAGALKVNIVGHRHAIDKASLIKAVTALLK